MPGCVDFTVHGPRDEVPERFKDRPAYYHNPEFTLVRLLRDEMEQLGAHHGAQAQRGARAAGRGRAAREGLSIPNVPGGAFWDPDADAAFRDALRADLRPDIPLITSTLTSTTRPSRDRGGGRVS